MQRKPTQAEAHRPSQAGTRNQDQAVQLLLSINSHFCYSPVCPGFCCMLLNKSSWRYAPPDLRRGNPHPTISQMSLAFVPRPPHLLVLAVNMAFPCCWATGLKPLLLKSVHPWVTYVTFRDESRTGCSIVRQLHVLRWMFWTTVYIHWGDAHYTGQIQNWPWSTKVYLLSKPTN